MLHCSPQYDRRAHRQKDRLDFHQLVAQFSDRMRVAPPFVLMQSRLAFSVQRGPAPRASSAHRHHRHKCRRIPDYVGHACRRICMTAVEMSVAPAGENSSESIQRKSLEKVLACGSRKCTESSSKRVGTFTSTVHLPKGYLQDPLSTDCAACRKCGASAQFSKQLRGHRTWESDTGYRRRCCNADLWH
jgi:hypothetical protein